MHSFHSDGRLNSPKLRLNPGFFWGSGFHTLLGDDGLTCSTFCYNSEKWSVDILFCLVREYKRNFALHVNWDGKVIKEALTKSPASNEDCECSTITQLPEKGQKTLAEPSRTSLWHTGMRKGSLPDQCTTPRIPASVIQWCFLTRLCIHGTVVGRLIDCSGVAHTEPWVCSFQWKWTWNACLCIRNN